MKKKYGDTSKTTHIFSPNLRSMKTLETYYKYCYYSLLRYKPWVNYKESVFSNNIVDKDICIDINDPKKDEINIEIQQKIIDACESFLIDPNRTSNNMDDSINREIDIL